MPASRRSGSLLLQGNSVSRVLTAAQTRALNTTPVEIVPAPGAGAALVFRYAIVNKPAGVAGAGGGNLNIRTGTTTFGSRSRAATFPAGATVSYIPFNSSNPHSVARNQSINVNMATGDMTGQDQDVTITVVYDVVEA